MRNFDTVIVGAGLSGLVAGARLKKAGRNVLLIEKSDRSGGPLRSDLRNGFLLEHGPNTVPAKPHLIPFFEEIGLIDELLVAKKNTARFVQFHGRLHRVPPGPVSPRGLLRALREPWISKDNAPNDETVWDFFERRFGAEVAERLIAPFVSGIWAGDARTLSLRAAFPTLAIHEERYDSVIKGVLFGPKKPKSKVKGLISFQKGIQTLVDRLAEILADRIETNTTIQKITPGRWTLETSRGPIATKQLILTLPAGEAGPLIQGFSENGAKALSEIPYAPIKVLHLGFQRSQVRHSLKGFGYLVAPSEKKNILGCLWSSTIFPERAPAGSVLLTVFVGGMTNPLIMRKTDDELVTSVLSDLRPTLGLQGAPTFQSITPYAKAIPQYTQGHLERIRILESVEKQFEGLYFLGNYRAGISVGDVIQYALKMTDQLQKSDRI